ncbi:hypothetical protein SKAU_G00009310 [Synaphobranchus kaupii]|uniref:Uncharacterized protein n=1 Tax=Synaphobranchus kaupii TaxID=118154 RepID=A0A9Q1GAM0_SYNKA|nr:hypothetical protein SKAU_G00009310 [Synaphobranchus kaupii]
MCCLPIDQTLPPAGDCISAQGSEPCSGAQTLASRLRWIGDQLEKGKATGDRGSKGDTCRRNFLCNSETSNRWCLQDPGQGGRMDSSKNICTEETYTSTEPF